MDKKEDAGVDACCKSKETLRSFRRFISVLVMAEASITPVGVLRFLDKIENRR